MTLGRRSNLRPPIWKLSSTSGWHKASSRPGNPTLNSIATSRKRLFYRHTRRGLPFPARACRSVWPIGRPAQNSTTQSAGSRESRLDSRGANRTRTRCRKFHNGNGKFDSDSSASDSTDAVRIGGGGAPVTPTREEFPSLDSPRLAVWQGNTCYALRCAPAGRSNAFPLEISACHADQNFSLHADSKNLSTLPLNHLAQILAQF